MAEQYGDINGNAHKLTKEELFDGKGDEHIRSSTDPNTVIEARRALESHPMYASSKESLLIEQTQAELEQLFKELRNHEKVSSTTVVLRESAGRAQFVSGHVNWNNINKTLSILSYHRNSPSCKLVPGTEQNPLFQFDGMQGTVPLKQAVRIMNAYNAVEYYVQKLHPSKDSNPLTMDLSMPILTIKDGYIVKVTPRDSVSVNVINGIMGVKGRILSIKNANITYDEANWIVVSFTRKHHER